MRAATVLTQALGSTRITSAPHLTRALIVSIKSIKDAAERFKTRRPIAL